MQIAADEHGLALRGAGHQGEGERVLVLVDDAGLRHSSTADAELTDPPWRDDPATAAADPSGDPNAYSYHYLSRLDITRNNGTRYRCEDLRAGCT
ncbi:hypothetical protein AWN90_22205 [Nocardia terpenica]|uniref:Uncharacterized protein n=1 Tax=Nocardia terpenica TaxID=455432 RepID=A0A164NUZ7_9NOCA|nr:hypothetical protein AWN90_22205 [Nocardia terpenica]